MNEQILYWFAVVVFLIAYFAQRFWIRRELSRQLKSLTVSLEKESARQLVEIVKTGKVSELLLKELLRQTITTRDYSWATLRGFTADRYYDKISSDEQDDDMSSHVDLDYLILATKYEALEYVSDLEVPYPELEVQLEEAWRSLEAHDASRRN